MKSIIFCQIFIICFIFPIGNVLYADQDMEMVWCTKFPLNFSDGTRLPKPLTTDEELKERIKQKQEHYRPFTENHVLPAQFERPEKDLSSALVWMFKEDANAMGELERWFAAEIDEKGWSEQKLPDYREFALGWYRTTFDAPEWSSDRIILHFDAVDYGARVFLNEHYIGEHTGNFGHFEFDITDFIKPSGNVLAVRVDNPVSQDGQQDSFQGDGMGTVAFHKERGVVQFSNAAGIYQPVKLIGRSNIYLDSIKATPCWPDVAEVEVRLVNKKSRIGDLDVEVQIYPRNFKGEPVSVKQHIRVSKEAIEAFTCQLIKPKYWTPDEPFLYTARVIVKDVGGNVVDSSERTFGMRWIEQTDDGTFLLNKKPKYFRGSGAFGNFWLASVRHDEQSIIKDILLFKAANLDIARPHLHVLPDYFYKYADMYGLMVYTDMTMNASEGFSGGATDMIPIYTEEAKRQFKEAADQLYNHPSIVIWQFINESQIFAPVTQIPPAIKELVRYGRAIDSTRLYCGSSGFTAPGVFSSSSNANKEWWGISDDHWYFGWYVKTPFYADYCTEEPKRTFKFTPEDKKFLSEYGSTAYPDWETWKESFTPWESPKASDDLWDVRRIPLERPCYRGLTYLGEPLQLPTMTGYIGESIRPCDWIVRSQAYQAYATKSLTDVLRRRPDISGYTHFHLIDPGPVAWPKAIVDSNRRPKEAYFALAQASAPQRVNIQYKGRRFYSGSELQGMNLWVYNDYDGSIDAQFRILIVDNGGKILNEDKSRKLINSNSRELVGAINLTLPKVEKREKVFLYVMMLDANDLINYDYLPIEVLPEDRPDMKSKIKLYDKLGKTALALESTGLNYQSWSPGELLDPADLLVVGAYSSDSDLSKAKSDIDNFLNNGGNVLVLNQAASGQAGSEAFDISDNYFVKIAISHDEVERKSTITKCDFNWLPFKIELLNSYTLKCIYAQNLNENLFTDGLMRNDLFEWYGGSNYVVETVINKWDKDETVMTCGTWQNCTAVLLKPVGKGKLLFSQLLLVDRYGIDPVASYIFNRMLNPDNWVIKKILTVNKKASIQDGNTLNVELTIINSTERKISGEIIDPVLQDVAIDSSVESFKQAILLNPGQTKELSFKRHLAAPYMGELPPAVFVFENGLWQSSYMVTVGLNLDSMEKIYLFDFGTKNSPVADGAIRVTGTDKYENETGFGWNPKQPELYSDSGRIMNPLLADYNAFFGSQRSFLIDLPEGTYIFRIIAGDISGNYKDPYSSDIVPPINILCNDSKMGRIVRLMKHGTATLCFKYTQKKKSTVEIKFQPSFEKQLALVSGIGIYKK
ncbi:MAG: hypothetical protein A2Y10_10200 [Planctomycetes bacterium GWF2_41_51]|nr:MAG: hypothetical protein A2Y10_10200 [Planctomycetes bacterium GWF2_41_51]